MSKANAADVERLALETLRALHRGGLDCWIGPKSPRTHADAGAVMWAARRALILLGVALADARNVKRERAAIARALDRLAERGDVERLALRSPVSYRIREEAEAAALRRALADASVETPEALAEALRDASQALAEHAEALAAAVAPGRVSATLRAATVLRDVRQARAHAAALAHSLAEAD